MIVQKSMDSHTKWVVAVTGTGIISLLTVLAMRDRQSIDQTLVHMDGRIRLEEQTSARHEADLAVLKNNGTRHAQDLAELKQAMKEMNQKLDRVLTEVRRNR